MRAIEGSEHITIHESTIGQSDIFVVLDTVTVKQGLLRLLVHLSLELFIVLELRGSMFVLLDKFADAWVEGLSVRVSIYPLFNEV